MARLPRVVIPDMPHHVVQRGVRSLALFRADADRVHYLELVREFCSAQAIRIWAWCLMDNHVHFVMVPPCETALARGLGEAHRRYTRFVNFREGVRGHLFQERFHSFPVQDDRHLLAVLRYVEQNPVRAGMVSRAEEYRWSSARHHVTGSPDPLGAQCPRLLEIPDWGTFLRVENDDATRIRRHVRTGRPWGLKAWVHDLEKETGRSLLPRRGGWPKGKARQGNPGHS